MPYPRKPKPWRGFPNANVKHAIRLRVNQASPAPGYGEQAFAGIGAANAIPIGTIPAGAIITDVYRAVETAFTATTTIDIGRTAGGTDILTSAVLAPQTTGRGNGLSMGLGANMLTADTVIYATAGTLLPTVGVVDIVIEFYVAKD